MFSLGTNVCSYIFQAKKVQMNCILLARGTIVCTYRVLHEQQEFVPFEVQSISELGALKAKCDYDICIGLFISAIQR